MGVGSPSPIFRNLSFRESPCFNRNRGADIVRKLPHRRKVLHLAAGAAALPALLRIARAQAAYPSRPVRVVVPFAAGGLTDILARLIGQWLSERLRQPFIIENRAGAASNIGTETVVKSPPDGYTLLIASSTNAINATVYDKLNFNFIRDIAPVATIGRNTFVIVVDPSMPAKSVPEFITYAKANPGKINIASAGTGSASHVFSELFKIMTGINTVHVPYRGAAPALADLLAGQVQAYFAPTTGSVDYIRAGKVRALAVTTATRSEALPDIPAVSEFVPGYEASGWSGFGSPKGTPSEVIDKLNREINTALADPKIKAQLADLGSPAFAGSPADFGRLIADETEKWAKVIRAANIKPE
jgi:tripartite-type tricarboxylate transporter receptor subunit TctC